MPNLLKIDLYKNRNFECCPHCGSRHFIRNGYYNGIQRYKCHGCKKTFSKTTNSVWYYSKKPSTEWIKYAELFLERQSLRKYSEALKMNLSTAFFWRHKIMNGLKSQKRTKVDFKRNACNIQGTKINQKLKNNNHKLHTNLKKVDENQAESEMINSNLKGDVFLTYGYFQERSYNGVINFNIDFYRTQHRIYVAAAKGQEDSMIISPVCRNFVFTDKFMKKVFGKIDKKSYIVLYRANHLAHITKNHNKRLKRKTSYEDMRIKRFQENANNWFSPFHGISTKYLENYLCYFILYNLDRCFEAFDFTYSLIKKIDFIKTHKIKFVELCI